MTIALRMMMIPIARSNFLLVTNFINLELELSTWAPWVFELCLIVGESVPCRRSSGSKSVDENNSSGLSSSGTVDSVDALIALLEGAGVLVPATRLMVVIRVLDGLRRILVQHVSMAIRV